jgi:hypothetical protein
MESLLEILADFVWLDGPVVRVRSGICDHGAAKVIEGRFWCQGKFVAFQNAPRQIVYSETT